MRRVTVQRDRKRETKVFILGLVKFQSIYKNLGGKKIQFMLGLKLNNLSNEIAHTRNILLVVITLFGIFTPLLFNLTSEKFDAKLDNVNSRMSGVEKRIDNIENRMDKINNKLDIIVKKLK